jgi:hypothetical protein
VSSKASGARRRFVNGLGLSLRLRRSIPVAAMPSRTVAPLRLLSSRRSARRPAASPAPPRHLAPKGRVGAGGPRAGVRRRGRRSGGGGRGGPVPGRGVGGGGRREGRGEVPRTAGVRARGAAGAVETVEDRLALQGAPRLQALHLHPHPQRPAQVDHPGRRHLHRRPLPPHPQQRRRVPGQYSVLQAATSLPFRSTAPYS